ncbi:hypothetical protein [Helicobacter canis]|uniref:hypothetical protein n=1 Tax=Helicobacter canis TaxID=29419 RepID=UPI00041D42E3|nr:hypothetical protein [Helicobacter canis]
MALQLAFGVIVGQNILKPKQKAAMTCPKATWQTICSTLYTIDSTCLHKPRQILDPLLAF